MIVPLNLAYTLPIIKTYRRTAMTEDNHDSDSEMVLGPNFMASVRKGDGQLVYRKRDKETKPFAVEVKRPRQRRVFVDVEPR